MTAPIFGQIPEKPYERKKSRKISPTERADMQIGKMHRTYGITSGEQCRNCQHFTRIRPGMNIYRKCRLFGVTHGPATDWRASYPACGKFTTEPIPGQTFFPDQEQL